MSDHQDFYEQRRPPQTFIPARYAPKSDPDSSTMDSLRYGENNWARPLEARDTFPMDMADFPTLKVRGVAASAPTLRSKGAAHALPGKAISSPAPSVISTSIALLLLLVANLLIQLDRRSWDIRSDGYWSLQRVQQCESLDRTPDVLFLGSSRVVYGVNANRVDSIVNQDTNTSVMSCNAGMFGSTFEQDYYTFKRFVEDGYVPKLLVEDLREYNLNTSAQSVADKSGLALSQTLPLADLSDMDALAWHYSGIPAQMINSANFAAGKLIPAYGDRIGLYKAVCNESRVGPCGADLPDAGAVAIARYKQSDTHGWVALNGISIATLTPAQKLERAVDLRKIEGGQLQHFTIGGHQPAFLARMIALAHTYHVRVALVVSPLHSTFFTLFDHPSDWTALLTYWGAFAQTHGVTFIDESRPTGFTDADWYDAEHLNAAGAEKYATILASTVVEPAWVPSQP